MRAGRSPTLSVVIPVLDEEAGLPALVARLEEALARAGMGWEVIFIDDGSRDGTLQALRDLNRREPRFKALALSRNFGKERALAAGLLHARGDAVVLMDADLQHPPEAILELLARWREGYAIVYGQRRDRLQDGTARRLLSRIFYNAFRMLSGTALPEGAGDFRLLDRKAVDALNRFGERTRYTNGLYAWIGFRQTGVPYTVAERASGRSRWNARRLFGFALDGLTSFSTIPLKVWSWLGLLISMLAFGYVLWFLIKTSIFGIDVPGFPTLAVSIMFFAGVQLISLGVLGEYLARVYEEVKARPLYIVAEEIGLGPAVAAEAEADARGRADAGAGT
jgi:glycosyltransferase involved in cell wall biosynthesis